METNQNQDALLNQLLAKVTANRAIDKLAPAFVAAYGEIDNVVKNAANPHFNSSYADLGAVLDTLRPIFAKHRLSLIQMPGKIDGDKISLTTVLLHESGQSISSEMQLPIGKGTAQAAGSALTYARRYSASAIAGIAQVDDDGNAASERPKEATKEKTRDPKALDTGITDAIAAASDLKALEGLKARVSELGDQAVAAAYVARKKAIKGAA